MKADKRDSTVREPVELYNLSDNLYEREELNLINNPEYKSRIDELVSLFDHMRYSGSRTTEMVSIQ